MKKCKCSCHKYEYMNLGATIFFTTVCTGGVTLLVLRYAQRKQVVSPPRAMSEGESEAEYRQYIESQVAMQVIEAVASERRFERKLVFAVMMTTLIGALASAMITSVIKRKS